jgi:hypothetical protein
MLAVVSGESAAGVWVGVFAVVGSLVDFTTARAQLVFSGVFLAIGVVGIGWIAWRVLAGPSHRIRLAIELALFMVASALCADTILNVVKHARVL